MYEIDSDNDGCNDIIEADFLNVENFKETLIVMVFMGGNQTFDNGNVDEREELKYNDANGYGTDPKKDNNGNYLFQTVGSTVEIESQPQSTAGSKVLR